MEYSTVYYPVGEDEEEEKKRANGTLLVDLIKS